MNDSVFPKREVIETHTDSAVSLDRFKQQVGLLLERTERVKSWILVIVHDISDEGAMVSHSAGGSADGLTVALTRAVDVATDSIVAIGEVQSGKMNG